MNNETNNNSNYEDISTKLINFLNRILVALNSRFGEVKSDVIPNDIIIDTSNVCVTTIESSNKEKTKIEDI
jgi:hypothetical protein